MYSTEISTASDAASNNPWSHPVAANCQFCVVLENCTHMGISRIISTDQIASVRINDNTHRAYFKAFVTELTSPGFVRYGNLRHPSGLACIMSNAAASQKRMYVGRQHAKERWTDVLGWHKKTVVIDKKGYGVFPVSAMSVSVWVDSAAKGRDTLQDPLYVD